MVLFVTIWICAPIRVREAVKNKAMRIMSAVDSAQVFRFDQITSNAQIGVEVLLRGIVNIVYSALARRHSARDGRAQMAM